MRFVSLIAMTSIILSVIAAIVWFAAPEAAKPAVISALPQTGELDPMVRDLIEVRRRELEANPGKARQWASLGWAFQGNGMPKQALECYQQAQALEPEEGRWPFYAALAQAELGDGDAAMASMTRASELRGDFGPTYWRRGIWMVDRGQLEEALLVFSHASRIDLDSPVPLIGIAKIAIARGQDQEAVAWLTNLLSQQPDQPYAKYLLAEAYQRLGETQEAAITRQGSIAVEPIWHDDWEFEIVQSATGYQPTLEAAQRNLAAGRWRLALERLEKLRQYWPNDPIVLSGYARAAMELGKYDEALLAANAALDHDQFSAEQQTELQSMRARILTRLARWPEAESAYVQLTKNIPDSGDLWLELANAQLMQGERDAAAVSLEQARQRTITQMALAKRIEEALAKPPASP